LGTQDIGQDKQNKKTQHRKLKRWATYIDSIEKIWQKSLAVGHQTTAKVDDCHVN
jgi:hypothetical protein